MPKVWFVLRRSTAFEDSKKVAKMKILGAFRDTKRAQKETNMHQKHAPKNVTKKTPADTRTEVGKTGNAPERAPFRGGELWIRRGLAPKEKLHFAPFENVSILEPFLKLFWHAFATAPPLPTLAFRGPDWPKGPQRAHAEWQLKSLFQHPCFKLFFRCFHKQK